MLDVTETAAVGAPFEALVIEVHDDPLRFTVRGADASTVARNACGGYVPREGDRVLVIAGGDDAWVIGVVKGGGAGSVRTPSGASAEVQGERVLVRNRRGEIVVEYDDAAQVARVSAPKKDLHFVAERRLVLEAGQDVDVRAGRALFQTAEKRIVSRVGHESEVVLDREELDVTTPRARLRAGEAQASLERLVTRAREAILTVGSFELDAERVRERAGRVFRHARALVEERAGSLRTIVEGAMHVTARETTIRSEKDTAVDGERVLLG